MAAIAQVTERVVIGPLITPPARRRIHKLARETVTLDRLSGGRGRDKARAQRHDKVRGVERLIRVK